MEGVSPNIAGRQSASHDCARHAPECDTHLNVFCGTDGQCHFYSCKSWYKFGPQRFTGFNNTNASQLVCQDIPITQPDWNSFYKRNVTLTSSVTSVSFQCSWRAPVIQMGFTNKCTVSTSNSNFECYGLAADTNFQPFLDEVAVAQLNCTGDDQNNLNEFPFKYLATTDIFGEWEFERRDFSLEEFNATLALTGTMSAKYETWTDEPTAEPTGVPTTAPTTLSTSTMSSASFDNESGMMAAARLLGVLYTFYLFL